ncbi:MAG: PEGA domain-containing protein [Sandaracinaceae bacterium]
MRRFAHLRWTCFVMALVAVPSTALAQATAALMPRIGGDEVGAEMQAAARAAATAVLREEGMLLIESLRIESLLDEAERECLPSTSCRENVFRHASVEVLVGLVLNGDSSGVQRVWVYVIRADGVREGATVVEGELGDAVADALRPLLDHDQPEPGGPFLQVDGTTGAHISIDGALVGDIPVTHPSTAGPHEVGAELAGHQSRRVRVTLPDDPSRTVTVDLRLEEEQPPVHWGVVVGAGAIAIGLGAAVLPPAISFVSAGCTDMGCTEFEEVDDVVWVWTAVGGAVAGAGVGLLIWGASQGDASVEARLLPNGAQLQGRF